MEKWKIAVIVGLLACLPVYGYLQTRQNAAPEPGATPTSEPPAVIEKLIGQPAVAWDIPADYWANTPKPITLEDLRGSVVLLEFWRAECPHCEKTAPFLERLKRDYGPKGLKIVAFQAPNVKNPASLEHRWNDVKARAVAWKINYPIAFDKGAKIFESYQCHLWPSFFLIDRNGVIRQAIEGHTPPKEAKLMKSLNEAMGVPSAGQSAAAPANPTANATVSNP